MSTKKSSNQTSNAKSAMESFKMEAASEVGVDLNEGGNLTTQEAGSVGGQMVKKMCPVRTLTFNRRWLGKRMLTYTYLVRTSA